MPYRACEGAFHYLVQGFFVLILVGLLAFSRKLEGLMSRRTTALIRSGAAFYFGVYTLSLPGAFGMLVHEPVYPRIVVSGKGMRAEGYRLFQDDRSLLLWSPSTRQITWLPLQSIDAIQSGGPRNIFDQP